MSAVPLYLSFDAGLDRLTAFEFGRVGAMRSDDCWRALDGSFRYLLREPGGPELGFRIDRFATFDVDALDVQPIWGEPHFDVPLLALRDASPGEIVIAARSFLVGQSTLNRRLFNAALSARGAAAVWLWRECLQAGDPMAHRGLGSTLFALGRLREAYQHLRGYTELAPEDSSAWCWYGRTCHELGEWAEARTAYERAIELTEAFGGETRASELLARLDEGDTALLPGDPPPPFIRETVFDVGVFLGELELDRAVVGEREPAPVVLFLAGAPLAGKAVIFESLRERNDPLIPEDPLIVDPMVIRGHLPEWQRLYQRADPAGAERIYERCCAVAREVIREAVAAGRNLVVNGVGGVEAGVFASVLQRFAAAGYEVRVLLVGVTTDLALARNEARAKQEGLLIDPDLLIRMHQDVSRRLEEWKDVPAVLRIYGTR